MSFEAIQLRSEGETITAELHGALPARRAAILVHGTTWDADGWREVAPRFVARGVPALALNLRGHGGSTGTVEEFLPGRPWSPMTDLRTAKAWLRERGVAEIALVGASLGGHAVLASSFEGDAECLVTVSAPVAPVPDELSRLVRGRVLYVCADRDRDGAYPNVQASFAALTVPKTLVVFGGEEHSRAMFAAPYGDEMLDVVARFVAHGLG
ncbi:MAG TPA: alpha/beta fold hydrolase [Candidatus Limnocylindrales bacterium]|nr:alpha/beta fold hydrolase [Candidatus Limnocylindrales bacterium]